MIKKRGCI